MQKGFAQPLLIFIIIIFVSIGIYLYQGFRINQSKVNSSLQDPKPTALKDTEFESYKSVSLGFSFLYPKNSNVKTDSEEEFNNRTAGAASKTVNGDYRKNFKGYVGYEPGKFLGAVAVLDKSDSFDTSPLSVWVFDNPDNITTERWFDRYWYYPYLWGVFDYTSKGHVALDSEATISGQLAKYKIIEYQPGKPKFMYVAKDQRIYLFRIMRDTGDKVLSSFKFLPLTNEVISDCKITGCSKQVCSDKEVITTCEMLSEYGCYANAKCERQLDGQCGWTKTEELNKCLAKY